MSVKAEVKFRQVKVTLYLLEPVEKIKVISISGKNEVVNEQEIAVGKKMRTCQECNGYFISATALSRHCGDICKAKAHKKHKEVQANESKEENDKA